MKPAGTGAASTPLLLLFTTLAWALAFNANASGLAITVEALVSASLLSPRGNGIAVSPHGRWVAFEMRRVDLNTNTRIADLYVIDADGRTPPIQLTGNTSGNEARAVRWSPDGRTLAFFADDGKGAGIWLAAPPHFKPKRLNAKLPVIAGINGRRAGNYSADLRWSPDSRELALTIDRPVAAAPKPMTGVRIGVDWAGDDPLPSAAALCIVTIQSKKTECLTPEDLNVLDFDWSPDGTRLVIAASRDRGYISYMSTDLYVVDRASQKVSPLVVQPGPDSNPVWSPDGQTIAFSTQNGVVDWLQAKWPAIVPVQGGEPRFLGEIWRKMSNGTAAHLQWSSDSQALYFDGNYRFGRHLFRLDTATGAVARITPDTSAYYRSTSLTHDNQYLAYTMETPVESADLYIAQLAPFRPRKLFEANPQLERFAKPSVQMLEWPSSDGRWTVQGSLIRPPDFREGTRYPLILWVQGGPGMAANEFNFSDQYPNLVLASRGYLILSINTRGRNGYGKAFNEAIGTEKSYGINPTRDLMDGVDVTIDKGIADPRRLGIMGFSYGGYLSVFAPTQTRRFKAASAGDPPVNMVEVAFGAGLSNLRGLREMMQGLGDPYIPAELTNAEAQSPLYQAHKIKTPMLLECGMLSSLARNCRAFYAGLQFFGVPSMLIQYPRTNHGIEEPKLLMDSYRRNLHWFDYWLRGEGEDPLAAK